MYICANCGSNQVESKRWVDMNTQKVGDTCSDGEDADNWCNSCRTHCRITTTAVIKEKFQKSKMKQKNEKNEKKKLI
jgi:hypothetical protein